MVTVKELIMMLSKLDKTASVSTTPDNELLITHGYQVLHAINLNEKPQGCGFTCGCED